MTEQLLPPTDALVGKCSFSIGGKIQSLFVYCSEDPELVALYNPHLIKAFEMALLAEQAIELKKRLRRHVSDAIRKNCKSNILSHHGIDVTAIAKHLGPRPSLNHQIDHIIPLAAFDFNNPEQIKQAFAPENHQWLPREKNVKKSDIWYHNGTRIKGRATWV